MDRICLGCVNIFQLIAVEEFIDGDLFTDSGMYMEVSPDPVNKAAISFNDSGKLMPVNDGQ